MPPDALSMEKKTEMTDKSKKDEEKKIAYQWKLSEKFVTKKKKKN